MSATETPPTVGKKDVRFRPGNEVGVKHGMTAGSAIAERKIAPLAVNHRRRILRLLKMSPKDLDPIGRAYLDQFVRLTSKLDLIDRYIAEHGLLDQKTGEPQKALNLYVNLASQARLSLARLENHIRVAEAHDPEAALAQYIDAEPAEIEEEAVDGDDSAAA